MSWQQRQTNRKRRRFCLELLENRWLLAGVVSQVGYFDTWAGGIVRSTDVGGIATHPSGSLYLVDPMIDDQPSIFDGDNLFEVSLSGDQVSREIASGTNEPTGITFNQFDGYFYVTDAESKSVARFDSALDNSRYEFAPENDVPSATDPRGITSAPSTGFLYVADGRGGGRQVLAYSLDMSSSEEATRGVNFEGVFSVADQMDEVEGIAYYEPSGHLFLIDSTQKTIFEYTTTGTFVQQYDISGLSPAPESPQGLTFGPTSSSSDDPDELSLYIADAGDLGSADGGVYEVMLKGITPIDIRVMGDVPYSQAEYPLLLDDLANVSPDDEFFVHLGDIKSQGICLSSSYANFRNAIRTSPIPVFIVPGDNEYNDCPDPVQAWTYWDFYLMRLEEYWSHNFTVLRQSVREENFAFVHEDVLFLGINLVGGTVHDENEWSQRMTDNAKWVEENFANFGNQVTSAVVFGHAYPNPSGGDRKQFGQDFVAAAQVFDKPILYMMGDQHGWALDHPFSAAPKVTRVIVEQGVPSVRVTISNAPADPFSFSTPDGSQPNNRPPVLTAIGNRSFEERSVLNINTWASDDSPLENLSFSLDAGAPQGTSINPDTGVFSWAPGETLAGDYSVTVRVRDPGGLEDFETFTITVTDLNVPPVLAPIGSRTVVEGNLLTFTAAASDDDLPANDLFFSLDPAAPSGATIHPTTGVFSWTPGESQGPAVYSVTVRVTDNGVPNQDDFETFEIDVRELNEAPQLALIGNKSIDEGSSLVFTALATDADLPTNNLTFSLDAGAPEGANIHPSTGQFSWRPPVGASPGDRTVTVRVADQDGLEDFEVITITVNDVNLPPMLAEIGAQNIDEGSPLSFTASASDADLPANNLTYRLDADTPDGATIDPITGVFNWVPSESDGHGIHFITVRVIDDGVPSEDDFETIRVTVAEVNQAPELAPISEMSVDEGNLLTFIALATDADLPANDMTFSLDAGAPAGTSIDPQSGQFTWTPTAGEFGSHTLTARVTDDGGLQDMQTFTITVNDVNLPPVLEAIGDQSVQEGNELSFMVSATDPDIPANNLTFRLDAGAPDGASIDPTTGEFTWTPQESVGPAVYSLTVRVVDDGVPSSEDFETITISVGEVNQAPELSAIGDKSVDEGSLLTFIATAIDADLPANKLSFSLDVGAPTGATIDSDTGEFRWRPPGGTSSGDHTLTVRVSDDSVPPLDDFETITITVEDVNLPPVLAAIGSFHVVEGSMLSFTASATDDDLPADNLSFSIDSGGPDGATIDPATGVFQWTPDETQGPGLYIFNVRVSDNGEPSLDDFETIMVTVAEENLPPVLATIGSQSVDEGSLLMFTASATDGDRPTNNLSFSLDAGAPEGATIDPNSGVFRWMPDELRGPAFYSVTVRVTDNGVPRLDDFETIAIAVGEVNQAPKLVAIGDKSVEEGSELTFTASVIDTDAPANNFTFSLDTAAPDGATINPNTGEFSWRPAVGTSPGDYPVTVRVSDDGIPRLDDFEIITITVVDVNFPPTLAPIAAQSVDEGTLLTFTAAATDADLPADNLTFSIDSGVPDGATIDPATGVFRWIPNEAQGSAVYVFNLRVNDGGDPSLEDFETITVTVEETNLPPVLAAIGAQTVTEESLLTFTAVASDADLPADNLSFSLDADAPDGATIDPVTGVFQWMPNESQGPAVYSLTVRVTDDDVLSLDDFETIAITVGEVNQAPELAAIGDKSVDEGSLLTFTAFATDADLPANHLSFSLDAGAPDGATIDASTGEFSWRPPGGTSLGDHSITVRVSDDSVPSLDVFETITITVVDVNLPPVLSVDVAQRVDEEKQIAFTVSAIDPDLPANNVVFSLDPGAPEGAEIDPISGEFRWTPTEAQGPAVHAIQVRATDDGTPSSSAVITIEITVDEVNQTPVLGLIGSQHFDIGSPVEFTVAATDADLPANKLTFSLTAGAPIGATIDPNTGVFSWTPEPGTPLGSHRVTIRVSDDGLPSRTAGTFVLFSSDIFPEINLEGNGQPIANADHSPATEDHTDFGALEIDDEVATFTYRIKNSGNAVLHLTGTPRISVSGPDADDFSVTLPPPESLQVGQSREFTIQFDPSDAGLRSAMISIQNNDRYRDPYQFSVQGFGRDPLDVNLDGKISVVDALAIVNQLARVIVNQNASGDIVNGPYNYDANRDGEVSVLDALVVINHLSTISFDSTVLEPESELAPGRAISQNDANTQFTDRSLEDDLLRVLADDVATAGLPEGTHRLDR